MSGIRNRRAGGDGEETKDNGLIGPMDRLDTLSGSHGGQEMRQRGRSGGGDGLDWSRLEGRKPEHGTRHDMANTLLISCDCGMSPGYNELVKGSSTGGRFNQKMMSNSGIRSLKIRRDCPGRPTNCSEDAAASAFQQRASPTSSLLIVQMESLGQARVGGSRVDSHDKAAQGYQFILSEREESITMSAESIPIQPSAFAEAIQELPLSALYAKVLELRNSISHLRRSNDELNRFVLESCDSEDEKRELQSYIVENEDVMQSMTERIVLLKAEIVGRGQQWIEVEENRTDAKEDSSSQPAPSGANGTNEEERTVTTPQDPSATGDRRQNTHDDQEQDGVYL
ncbi:hypothetical protein EYZ11_002291 [Aspergillus tanneri]|uniref:Uncharacterized protein n=1 Tax=Aspergillus tanneri TaxID=1220188 RepID=A0A4S3JR30_9EURO|nr:hypothetical protein EYZ11_002291 [Aspergillus tanneri]